MKSSKDTQKKRASEFIPEIPLEEPNDNSKKKQKKDTGKEEKLLYVVDIEALKKTLTCDRLMVIPTQVHKHSQKQRNDFSNVSMCMYHEKIRNVYHDYFAFEKNELKIEFLFNLILMWEQTFTVIKFDSDRELFYYPSRKEKFTLIRKRLQYLKKKNVSSDKQKSISEQFKEFVNNARQLYELPIDKSKSSEYNHYSVIHTLFSSWSFYVYPFTHRMKIGTNDPVHSLTKMKLLFPNTPNMYILFHGKTVHNGAETKMSSLSSTCISRDERLFSYITVFNESSTGVASRRSKVDGLTSENKTHRENMKMCFELGECAKCQTHNRNDCFQVDLGQLYQVLKSGKSGKNVGQKPILGDLNEYGFEVWVGENSRLVDYINLKSDLINLAEDKKKWKGLDNNTNRTVAAVARTALGENQMKSPETIERFVSQLEKLLNKRSFGNRQVEVGKSAIILNRASLSEQFPHRDFSTGTSSTTN